MSERFNMLPVNDTPFLIPSTYAEEAARLRLDQELSLLADILQVDRITEYVVEPLVEGIELEALEQGDYRYLTNEACEANRKRILASIISPEIAEFREKTTEGGEFRTDLLNRIVALTEAIDRAKQKPGDASFFDQPDVQSAIVNSLPFQIWNASGLKVPQIAHSEVNGSVQAELFESGRDAPVCWN